MKHRIVTVTPAGRYPYLQILHRHLLRHRHIIDKHIWWVNTRNQEDVAYLHYLRDTFPYFYELGTIDEELVEGCFSIHRFFPTACDPECLYIRLDDDICWIEPDAIQRLASFRSANPEPFLVSGNVINNPMCNYLHVQQGALPPDLECTWNSHCPFSWEEPNNSRHFHHWFFQHLNDGTLDRYVFPPHSLDKYERFGINCISWLGSDFAQFGGRVARDEEDWLSRVKPCMDQRPCVLYGSALFVHYAYYTQRPYLEEKSNCLQLYDDLSRETSQGY